MTLVDDLKAVRTLLTERGRGRDGCNADQSVGLQQAVIEVAADVKTRKDARDSWPESRPYNSVVAVQARMNRALAALLPLGYDGNLSVFNNDDRTTDEDVFGLIDSALEESGGL